MTAVGGVNDDALDLRAADLAASPQLVQMALHLQLLPQIDTRSPIGRSYQTHFSVRGRRDYVAIAEVAPDGASFSVYGSNTVETGQLPASENYAFLADVSGAFDVRNRVVRISIPGRLLALATAPGSCCTTSPPSELWTSAARRRRRSGAT